MWPRCPEPAAAFHVRNLYPLPLLSFPASNHIHSLHPPGGLHCTPFFTIHQTLPYPACPKLCTLLLTHSTSAPFSVLPNLLATPPVMETLHTHFFSSLYRSPHKHHNQILSWWSPVSPCENRSKRSPLVYTSAAPLWQDSYLVPGLCQRFPPWSTFTLALNCLLNYILILCVCVCIV
jgi:hypothetical protein